MLCYPKINQRNLTDFKSLPWLNLKDEVKLWSGFAKKAWKRSQWCITILDRIWSQWWISCDCDFSGTFTLDMRIWSQSSSKLLTWVMNIHANKSLLFLFLEKSIEKSIEKSSRKNGWWSREMTHGILVKCQWKNLGLDFPLKSIELGPIDLLPVKWCLLIWIHGMKLITLEC